MTRTLIAGMLIGLSLLWGTQAQAASKKRKEELAAWTEWASTAPLEQAEYRKIFLRKVKFSGKIYLHPRTEPCRLGDWPLLPLPARIKYLHIINCQLDAIPALTNKLTGLTLDNVGLSQQLILPDRLEKLTSLDLSNNQLTTFSASAQQFPKLETLRLPNNQLIELHGFPETLTWLDARNNELKTLDALPQNLEQLWVSANQLTALPESLPERLQELDISRNQITQLPAIFPPSLRSIDISGNPIESLPDALLSLAEQRRDAGMPLTLIARDALPLVPDAWILCDSCDFGEAPTMSNEVQRAKTAVLDFSGPVQARKLPLLLEHAQSECEADPSWASKNSSLVNQLLYTARHGQVATDATRERADALSACYLQPTAMQRFAAAVSEIIEGKAGQDFYVFVSDFAQNKMLALTREGYAQQAMGVQADTGTGEWANSLLTVNNAGTAELVSDIKSELTWFNLLEAIHQGSIATARLNQLLNSYKLPEELHQRFKDALQVKHLEGPAKTLSESDITALEQKLTPLQTLSDGAVTGITTTHLNEIMQTYAVSENSKARAAHLLALSAVFVKYSSAAMFGTEHDSPLPLRRYANALLLEARKLDTTLMGDALYADLQNRMMGGCDTAGRQAFTCANVLYRKMLQFFTDNKASQPALEQAYDTVIPPAWR